MGSRYLESAPAYRSCTNSSLPRSEATTRSTSASHFSGSKGWFTSPQLTSSAVTGSFTVNLSFGVRPVYLPVYATSAPLSASSPSPRRTACSTRMPECRLRWTLSFFRSVSRAEAVSMAGKVDMAEKVSLFLLGPEGWSQAAGCGVLRRLDQRVLGRANFLQDRIQMFERLIHRQRVHLPSMLIRAGFNRRLQKMPGNLDGKRIGYDPTGALLVLHPCWMRQRNPYGTPAGKKLYVNSVGVPGRNRDNQGLVNTVEFLSGPAVGGVKVLVHAV